MTTDWRKHSLMCKAIAKDAHAGQVRRGGGLYVRHPIRVAGWFSDGVHQSVAYLHDVIEDTELSADDLLAKGVDERVVQAVVAMTKVPGERYSDYLARVKADPLARAVKVADIADNLTDRPTDNQKDRYVRALIQLCN